MCPHLVVVSAAVLYSGWCSVYCAWDGRAGDRSAPFGHPLLRPDECRLRQVPGLGQHTIEMRRSASRSPVPTRSQVRGKDIIVHIHFSGWFAGRRSDMDISRPLTRSVPRRCSTSFNVRSWTCVQKMFHVAYPMHTHHHTPAHQPNPTPPHSDHWSEWGVWAWAGE